MILLVTSPSSVSSGVATKKASVSVDQWIPRVLRLPAGVAQSQVRCLSQLLWNLLQHLGGVAPPLSEHHLPLCHETAEILEFLECLFWCVGSREAIVNVKRFLDHGCSFRILVLVVICHLVEHSCGQEWEMRQCQKSTSSSCNCGVGWCLDLWPGICACPSLFCPEQFPGTFCECLR